MAVAGSVQRIGTNELEDTAVTNAKLAGGIANNKLVNDSLTVNGTEIDLGASETITAGKILQVVNAVNTTQSTHNSATAADLLTADITPSSTSSKIYVHAIIPFTNTQNGDASFFVDRDSTRLPSAGITAALINTGDATNNNGMMSMCAAYVDSPSSTSQLTYKLKVVTSGTTMYINRRGLNTGFTGATTLTLMEIAG
jgi:hypothetical protein